jgi:hypothetical protein
MNNYTKGIFSDGTTGWKVNRLGQHWNNQELEHLEVVWSDETECICDTVYDIEDAKLIAAAPEMYEALKALLKCYEEKGQLLSFNVDIARQAINKAESLNVA